MTDSSDAVTNEPTASESSLENKDSAAPAEKSSRRDVLLGTAVVATAAAATVGDAVAQRPSANPVAGRLEEWGEPVAIERMPVVFHFRPDRMVRVSRERLREWEQLFATRVGVSPSTAQPGGTISGSGGVNGDWDDCDYYA